MNISYRSDANHNYMIIEKDKNVKTSHEKMVIRNNIDGLLKMNLHFVNENAYYYYEISSRQSLSGLFEGRRITYDEMKNFLYGMVKVFRELEAYLLPADELIIDPDVIFVDIETCSPQFAFYPYPDAGASKEADFMKLACFLAEHADEEDRRSGELAYEYYSHIADGIYSPETALKTAGAIPAKENTGSEELTFDQSPEESGLSDRPQYDYWETEEDMSELDYFLKNDKEETKDKGAVKIAGICLLMIALAAVIYLMLVLNPSLFPFPEMNEKEYITAGCVIAMAFGVVLTAFIFLYNKKQSMIRERMDNEKREKLERNEEDPLTENEKEEYNRDLDDMEEDDGKTTLLSMSGKSSAAASLSGREFGKNLYFKIDKDPFILGKKRDKADGVINDKSVSRMHAAIRKKNGRYFVSDLNSTNGTYINGRRLEPNETAGLEDNDTLAVAQTYLKFRSC